MYDEPLVDASGKRPASVFLVGRQGGFYRIGLVIQPVVEDDDQIGRGAGGSASIRLPHAPRGPFDFELEAFFFE